MHPTTQDLLIPLTHLAPSATNPRTRMSQLELTALAESIAQYGVIQPLVARPVPNHVPGTAPLEIVAGHRRWRACCRLTEAGRNPHGQHVPVLVHELDDARVLVMQLVENIQREDLHPLEEAEHYRRMRDDPTAPASVETIAHTGNVSPSRVYERLSLLALVPAAREAFTVEKLSLKTALLVARMPAALQAEAAEHLGNWGGEPMAPKAAAAFLRDRYMLRLALAPFEVGAEDLLPEAGSCTACPKRTGSNPQLFGDISDADTCTDPGCFAQKKAAQRARLVDELRTTGFTVVQGEATRSVCNTNGRLKPGYFALEQMVPTNLGDPTLKIVDVLQRAQAANADTLAVDHSANPVVLYAITTEALENALRKIKAHRAQLDRAAAAKAGKAKPQGEESEPTTAGEQTEAAVATHTTTRTTTKVLTEEEWPFPGSSGSPGAPEARAELDTDLVDQLLAFKPPATVAGRYNGHTPGQYADQQQRRARGILAAARVGHTMATDGADGLPAGISQMIVVGHLHADLYLQVEDIAKLCSVPPPDSPVLRDRLQWAQALPEESAARVAMVMLACCETDGADGFQTFAQTAAEVLGIDISDVDALALDAVNRHLQLGALSSGSAKVAA